MSAGRSSVRVTSLCSVSLSGDWTTTTETENTQTDFFSLCSDVTVVLYRCKGFSFDKDVGALWTREHSDFSFLFLAQEQTKQKETDEENKVSQHDRSQNMKIFLFQNSIQINVSKLQSLNIDIWAKLLFLQSQILKNIFELQKFLRRWDD